MTCACVNYLNYIGTKYDFPSKNRILIAADNEHAIKAPKSTKLSIKHTYAPDIDVILEIKHSIKKSPFAIILKHVKGHQDKLKPFTSLSPLALQAAQAGEALQRSRSHLSGSSRSAAG